MDSPDSDLVFLGTLTRPHGHKGAVRFFPAFSPPELMAGLKSRDLQLSPDGPDRPRITNTVRLLRATPKPPFLILFLEGVDSMDAAEALRGQSAFVPRAALWDLPGENYFECDLVGCTVADQATGEELGTVQSLKEGAGHDHLVVRTPDGAPLLIPFVKAIVRSIDTTARRILTELPPGLTDLQRPGGK